MSKKTAIEIIADFISGRHHIGYESAYSSAEDLPAYLEDAGYRIVQQHEQEVVAEIYKEIEGYRTTDLCIGITRGELSSLKAKYQVKK